jgi:hypothetical protein
MRRVLAHQEADEADRAAEMATAFADQLIAEAVINNVDPGAAIYALWFHLTASLIQLGWTPDELKREAIWHAADPEGLQ